MERPWLRDACAVLALLVLLLLLYRKVTRLWWTYDDAYTIHQLVDYKASAPFTDAKVWPQKLFTPLLNEAFEGEYALWQLDAPRWYVAQLLLAWIAAFAVYAASRLFLDRIASFAASALFVAGVPMCSVITQLSTLHYLIAITLVAITTILYVKGDPIIAAVFYLAAMFAKEIAVPLPILLAFLVPRRKLSPFAIALFVYLVWRRAVIGAFLGAYSWVIEWREWPRLLAMLPWRIVRAMAGAQVVIGVILIALMLGVILWKRRALLPVAIAALVVLGPLLPLAKEVNRRYVLALVANRGEWKTEFATRLRMSDEARVLFQMPPNGLMRLPATPPAVMRELNWMKTTQSHLPSGAAWFYDDYYLCSHDVSDKRAWTYDKQKRALVEITSTLPAIAKQHCASIRNDVPLTVQFHFRDPALHWEFGPYNDGKYTALLFEGVEACEVTRAEALNIPGTQALEIRVRYDSPQGWTTYSPDLKLDFTKATDTQWQR